MGMNLGIMIGIGSNNGAGGGGTPTELQTLTLSNTSFSQDTVPTTTIASIGGKTSGSKIEIIGGNGKLALNSSWTLLIKGLIGPAAGTFDITLREIHPTLGTKDTVFTITVTALTGLHPSSASQAMAGVYSLKKVVTAYAGNCLQVRDSTSTLRTVGFDGNGDLDPSVFSAWGDGLTFTVATWYDQSGNANNLTSSSRPKLVFPNAPTNYNGSYIDFSQGTGGINLLTVNTFLNVGGTNNLAAFVVASRLGYGSASNPHPRPGSPSTSIGVATLLGYGTAVGGKLLTSISNLGNGQNDATSFSINRDSLGRSAAPYDLPEWLALEEAAPSATAGFINMWFNQSGATVSGGGDTRIHYSAREHGVTGASAQRLVVGATGNLGLQHNGGVKEVILFNPASPLSDTESQRIGIWQNGRWTVQDTVWANRYFVVGLGQSNINGQFSANTSGDNTGGTESITRRFIPKMAEAIGINSERILAGYSNRTMRGGTALLKRPMPGDPTTDFYFWDEDTSTPGNLWTGVDGSSVGNIKGYLDAIKYMKYKRVVIVYAQGEEDAASSMTGDPRRLQWAQQSYSYPDYVRNYIGQPEAPIVYQPLARYDAGLVNSKYMRRLQASYLTQQFNCFLAPDTGHLSRGTGANYIAHLGTMAVAANGGYDATTGGAEDGYQRAAWQNAKAAGHAIHMVQGKDLALNDNWRGPELSAAVQSGASTIDVTVSYPYGCGGSDISTVSGQYGGFTVYNASNVAQTISSVSKVNATTMRITLSGSVPVGWSVVYDPNYASGTAEGANVRNQLVDNNSELNLPVASSQILTG